MVGTLLLRGMLAGVFAGIVCFCFLKVAGEPAVDRAIAFETQMDEAKAHAKTETPLAHDHNHDHDHHGHDHAQAAVQDEPEPELVSRSTQAGIGLFTGAMVYSAAFGGLFGLAFAFVYGRMGPTDPRTVSVLLASAGFIAVYLVPDLKYPASPPSVGAADTIGMRTALYFAMIGISLAATVGCAVLRKALLPRYGDWNATLITLAAYLCLVTVAGLLLPVVNEVPDAFPASLLWQFRVAALGAQALMWATIGLVFGVLTERERVTLHPKASPLLEQ